MVIMTAKVSKRKILLIGLLIILAVVLLITCLKKSSGSDTPPDTAEEITEVATNEARVAFLEQFGWEVQAEPVQTQQVRVPEDPSEVFRGLQPPERRDARLFHARRPALVRRVSPRKPRKRRNF